MMKRIGKSIRSCIFLLMLFVIIPATGVLADGWEKIDDSSWCSNERWSFFDDTACEVRELNIPRAWKKISVDANPNGGIKVEGWDKDSIRVQARVQANAGSKKKAEDLISEIDIETGGNKIHARGPNHFEFGSKKSWSVSYRLMVPVKTNLKLTAMNGGISIHDVNPVGFKR